MGSGGGGAASVCGVRGQLYGVVSHPAALAGDDPGIKAGSRLTQQALVLTEPSSSLAPNKFLDFVFLI